MVIVLDVFVQSRFSSYASSLWNQIKYWTDIDTEKLWAFELENAQRRKVFLHLCMRTRQRFGDRAFSVATASMEQAADKAETAAIDGVVS